MLSIHVSASEHQGGERDERCGVGEQDERGVRGVYLRRGGCESCLGLSGEGVGEGGGVLAGEEPAGVGEGLVPYRQVEDDGFHDE